MAKDRDAPRPPPLRLAGSMEREVQSDEEIITAGRRRILELCRDSIEVLEEIMIHGGPGDAPRVSAIGRLHAMASEHPWAVIHKPSDEASDVQRQVTDAVERLHEGAGLNAPPVVDDDGDPASHPPEPH